MSAHTPGPWRLEEVADDCGRIVKLCPVDSEDQSILTVVEHEGIKFAAVYIDADARLIAAAPELLDFAQWVISDRSDSRDLYSKARAAIAKATTEAKP